MERKGKSVQKLSWATSEPLLILMNRMHPSNMVKQFVFALKHNGNKLLYSIRWKYLLDARAETVDISNMVACSNLLPRWFRRSKDDVGCLMLFTWRGWDGVR
jgi:hypothetical protein